MHFSFFMFLLILYTHSQKDHNEFWELAGLVIGLICAGSTKKSNLGLNVA